MIDLGSISRVLFLIPAALLLGVAGACGDESAPAPAAVPTAEPAAMVATAAPSGSGAPAATAAPAAPAPSPSPTAPAFPRGVGGHGRAHGDAGSRDGANGGR